jgi:signal transduction histidine kinase
MKKSSRAQSKIPSGLTLEAFAEEQEWPINLPLALMSERGELLEVSPRMLEVLGIDSQNVHWPMPFDLAKNFWPFFTEHAAGPAVYEILLKNRPGFSLVAQAHLKTFRIRSVWDDSGSFGMIRAEVLRSGDLLQDHSSRQELFRALSHEIRTSVTSLKGYIQMLEMAPDQVNSICPKMNGAIGRLEKVIQRLSDFKLETPAAAKAKASKTGRSK